MTTAIPNQKINGVTNRYCSTCECWKPADSKHFHKYNAEALRRQCAACVNETRRALTPEKIFDDTERQKWSAIIGMGEWPTNRASARSVR